MSNNFKTACIQAEELWFDSLDYMQEEHSFSKKFERKMSSLIDKMRNDKYHHLTVRTTRALIIAAIVIALATTAFASPRSREYIIEKFSDHSKYTVTDGYEGEVDDLIVSYIPDGFELVYNYDSDVQIAQEYKKGDEVIYISKSNDSGYVFFDTELNEVETIDYDDIEYIYCDDLDGMHGIVWNYSNYEYYINSNLDKDTIVKIAKNIK
jgi:hypothetical protein